MSSHYYPHPHQRSKRNSAPPSATPFKYNRVYNYYETITSSSSSPNSRNQPSVLPPMNTAEDLLQLQRFKLEDPFSDSSPYRVGNAISESDFIGGEKISVMTRIKSKFRKIGRMFKK